MIFELVLSDKDKEKKLYDECIKARDKIERWHEPVKYNWAKKCFVSKYQHSNIRKYNTLHKKCVRCGHKYRVFRTAKDVTPCPHCKM